MSKQVPSSNNQMDENGFINLTEKSLQEKSSRINNYRIHKPFLKIINYI